MCKLLIASKKNNSQLNEFRKIIKAQESSLSDQPHGIGGLVIDKNNRISVRRELNEYGKVFNWVYSHIKNAKVVIIHTRQATDGNVDEKNIHLFNLEGYYFAHNGIVSKFSRYGVENYKSKLMLFPQGRTFKVFGDDDIISENPADVEMALKKEEITDKNQMSDSYHFLKELNKPITKIGLAEAIENKGFIGIGVLVGERDKKVIVFSTREFAAHTDFKNYSIVYSYDPVKKLSYYKDALGFPIMLKEKSEKIKTYSVRSGVYEINYAKGRKKITK